MCGLSRNQPFCDGSHKKTKDEESGKVYAYDIDCWNTCQLFKKGHRIRIEVASSAFPKFSRNLNTADALGMTANMKVAKQTILHDAEHASYVLLPIIPAQK